MTEMVWGIRNDAWFKLPLKLRQRWWDETEMCTRKPSADLRAEMERHGAHIVETRTPPALGTPLEAQGRGEAVANVEAGIEAMTAAVELEIEHCCPIEIRNRVTVSYRTTLTLSEVEARALDALVGYGDDAFLTAFKDKLGASYMRDHEAGLRSFFAAVRKDVLPALGELDDLRDAAKRVRFPNIHPNAVADHQQ